MGEAGCGEPVLWVETDISYIHATISYIYAQRGWLFEKRVLLLCNRQAKMKKYVIISTSIDLVRIAPENIVYISSDGNYSTLVQSDNTQRTLTYQLGQVEQMLFDQLGSRDNVFIRVGKSLIINLSFVHYININRQRLVLSDVATFSHTVSASKESLKMLKEYLQKEANIKI